MKRLVLILAALTLACAGKKVNIGQPPLPSNKPDVSAVMAVIGRFGMAHACPVDGQIVTAAHVVNPFFGIPGMQKVFTNYSWSDGRGHSGFVRAKAVNNYRDLGLLKTTSGDSPDFYKTSDNDPKAGDKVYWVEYDLSKASVAYKMKTRQAKVLRVKAGHFVFDGEPVRGASGSCVFNKAGEVVGILIRLHPMASNEVVSVAVMISGKWRLDV